MKHPVPPRGFRRMLTVFILLLLVSVPGFCGTSASASSWVGSAGSLTLDVHSEQVSGPVGRVSVTAYSGGSPIDEAAYQSLSVQCVVMPMPQGGPMFGGGMPPMGPGGPMSGGGMPPMGPGGPMPGGGMGPGPGVEVLEAALAYTPNVQGLSGTCTVNSPGVYNVVVTLNDGQSSAQGSCTVEFTMKQAKPITVHMGKITTETASDIFGWEGLNFTIQKMEVLSRTDSGNVELGHASSGNSSGAISIRGTRPGDVDISVSLIYNSGQSTAARFSVHVTGTFFDSFLEFFRSLFLSFQNSILPLALALALLAALVAFLFYHVFMKRIPGSFVIACEGGGASFRTGMNPPGGRSYTLLHLLEIMLKQRSGDSAAAVVKKLTDDPACRSGLRNVHVYMIQQGGQTGYAFSKDGSSVMLDETFKLVYPQAAAPSAQFKVQMRFIAEKRTVRKA